MIKKQNNYAFIDSQNLNLSIRECGWELDFGRFFIFLKYKYKVTKAFLFLGFVQENKKLYSYLKKCGYILIFKPIVKNNKTKEIKGNVDAELVLHAMIEYKNYDKAIIVSGDGDFYCLIEHLRKNKKLDSVIIPNSRRFSSLLRIFRPYFAFIDKSNKKLGKRKNRQK